MTTSNTAACVLDAAADIIVQRGHHRGHYVDPGGSGAVCALGAIRIAAWGTTDADLASSAGWRLHDAAVVELEEFLGESIVRFSDVSADDAADVASVFLRAAEAVR